MFVCVCVWVSGWVGGCVSVTSFVFVIHLLICMTINVECVCLISVSYEI